MSEKVRGIVIESKDKKEKDSQVVIYTLEKGKILATFKGVRSEKAKLKASKQIFTFGDFFIENTKGANIVTQVDIIENFYPLSKDLDKYYEACSIVDAVKKLGLFEPDPPFFVEIIKALRSICFFNVHKNYTLCRFLVKVFEGAGYPINLSRCASCKMDLASKMYFNFDVGEIVCSGCKTFMSTELSYPAFCMLKTISGVDYDKLATAKFSDAALNELLTILLKNFEYRFNYTIFCAV